MWVTVAEKKADLPVDLIYPISGRNVLSMWGSFRTDCGVGPIAQYFNFYGVSDYLSFFIRVVWAAATMGRYIFISQKALNLQVKQPGVEARQEIRSQKEQSGQT